MSLKISLEETLQSSFQPTHLEVINESSMHAGPADAQTHFKVIMVSKQFEGKSLIQRHRAVNELLDPIWNGTPLHALSLHLKTPDEWTKSSNISESPKCRGGSTVSIGKETA